MTRIITHMVPSTAATQPLQIYIVRPLKTFVRTSQLEWELFLAITLIKSIDSGFERPSTPNSGNSSPPNEPPEFVSRSHEISSDDDDDPYSRQRSKAFPRKKGGYDSKIEQILYENPDLQIIITDAGKSQESGASFIVYTIRTGVRSSHVQAYLHNLLISSGPWS